APPLGRAASAGTAAPCAATSPHIAHTIARRTDRIHAIFHRPPCLTGVALRTAQRKALRRPACLPLPAVKHFPPDPAFAAAPSKGHRIPKLCFHTVTPGRHDAYSSPNR